MPQRHSLDRTFRTSRRGFLRLGAIGLSLPEFFASQAVSQWTGNRSTGRGGRAKSCIVLFAWGGMSHLDTWDLKPQAGAEIRGEFQSISTAVPGIRISEHLPRLAQQTKRLAIVRSVHHEASDHREAAYWNLTGHQPRLLGQQPIPPTRRDWPCIGSQVARALYRQPTSDDVFVDELEKEKIAAGNAASRPPQTVVQQTATDITVHKQISLSSDVLGPGQYWPGSFDRQDGYTNNGTVELIGMISQASEVTAPLTRQLDGPLGDFSGLVAGDGTAGQWGSDVHGRGGNLYLPGDGEADVPQVGFGAHANKFITFDLQQVREKHFDGEAGPLRLTGRVGVNGAPGVPPEAAIQAGVWVDGQQWDLSDEIVRDRPSHAFELFLHAHHRYLTLAMLNGRNSTHFDDVAFRDVNLALVSGNIPKRAPSQPRTEPEPTEVSSELGNVLPKTICLPYPIADRGLLNGQSGGFLGAKFDPVYVRPGQAVAYRGKSPPGADLDLRPTGGLTVSRFAQRRQLLAQLDEPGSTESYGDTGVLVDFWRERAMDLMLTPTVQGAFDLRQERRSLRDSYGRHVCGQSALLARRLTEAGVPLVTVYCSAGDLNGAVGDHWDTHGNNFNRLKNDMLPPLDQAASALLDDLTDRGRLDETLVVLLTEFGRTPKINGGAGRDHFPGCYSVVFAGGGIQGGQVYGASDSTGSTPAASPCRPADLHATVFSALGIDRHFEVQDLEGRPLPLCDGEPLELF